MTMRSIWPGIQDFVGNRMGLTQQTDDPLLQQIMGVPQTDMLGDDPLGMRGGDPGGAAPPAAQAASAGEPRSWKSMSRDQKLEMMNKIAEDMYLGMSAASDYNLQPAQSVHMPSGGGGVTLQPYAPPQLGLGGIRG